MMNPVPTNGYCVVTGAANGLGKAFALELAGRNLNTLLVDLPGKGLPELCSHIHQQFNVLSHCFECDLTKKDQVLELGTRINGQFPVFLLINNAGTGGSMKFEEAPADYLDRIIQLNVMATTLLTRQLIPNLLAQKKSYILNVSSMAAFSPIGYKTIYPASKIFVHYFSRSLYQEYKKTNLFVSVVNPGPMKTNPEVTRRIEKQGFFSHWGVMTPAKVAAISIRQLFKRDTMIMLRFINRLNWLVLKLVPIYIRLPLLSRAIKKELIVN
ncbi:MAG: SDR family NAD(P)-dependent oxidoreductase [Bacteroidales bacterium]|nr:SDR family NAD(P)-dependent oxidoreductase [Bacteroidales bacterium]